jgi:hypothetical protein
LLLVFAAAASRVVVAGASGASGASSCCSCGLLLLWHLPDAWSLIKECSDDKVKRSAELIGGQHLQDGVQYAINRQRVFF